LARLVVGRDGWEEDLGGQGSGWRWAICAGGKISGDTTTLEDFQVIASLQKKS